jgi:hypothetical protein
MPERKQTRLGKTRAHDPRDVLAPWNIVSPEGRKGGKCRRISPEMAGPEGEQRGSLAPRFHCP